MDYLVDNWPVLFLITIYIALCLYIGWWFQKKASEGVSAYYIAKREIPGWVVSLAFFSTFISTNTYIGQAGQAFSAGLCWAWVGLFWTAFCMISWLLLGPRMRNQTATLNSVTIPDYFDYRYKSSLSRIMRAFAAFIIIFATLWYMVGIAKGCAHLLDSVLKIPYAWGAFLIIFITCAYTVWGGMYSVLWTDAIQGLMMFFVAIIMVLIPAMYVGGWGDLMANISNVTHITKAGKPMGRPRHLLLTCLIHVYSGDRFIRRHETDRRTAVPHSILLYRQRKKHEICHDCHPHFPGCFSHLRDGAWCTCSRHGNGTGGGISCKAYRPGYRIHVGQIR